jgi:hypothetical protein
MWDFSWKVSFGRVFSEQQEVAVSCWFLAWLILSLNMDTTSSSETSIGFLRTTRHYIPKDKGN